MSIRGGSSNSLEITVRVEELIGILRTNRSKHVAEYEAQIVGWRNHLSNALLAIVNKIRGEQDPLHIDTKLVDKLKTGLYKLPTPVSNQVDYDRTIGMLEMHLRAGHDTIALEAQDYARYVDDDWEWKDTFLQNSVTYGDSH